MKTILATMALFLLVLVAAAFAFVHSGVYDVSASKPHTGLFAWLMHATMEASVERRAHDVQVPDLEDESLLAGVNDFEAMCVGCHGAPGKEPGPAGQGLNPPPPDLAESAREMSPAELFWVTRNGIRMSGMPAWSATHSDDELWPVVALMMALPDMSAAEYADLKERAEGMGHHGDGSSAQDEGHDHDDPPEDAGHDHGTHEH